MTLSRRWFLKGTTMVPMVAALPLTSGCAEDDAPPAVFVHGVASGDPTPTALIIWTRVSTAPAGTSLTPALASTVAISTDANASPSAARPTPPPPR